MPNYFEELITFGRNPEISGVVEALLLGGIRLSIINLIKI
jgi:hypothetical protein